MTDEMDLGDEGMRRVMGAEDARFKPMLNQFAMQYLSHLRPGDTFVFEELRLWACKRGMWHPHHPNVWGAAARELLKDWVARGLVEYHGVRRGKSKGSHGQLFRCYRKLA